MSIWIDIEGFSKLWEDGGFALAGLRALMSGIYAIGNKVYTDDGDRLFAHQFGDGFVIVGDFHEEALDRCVAIAVALMRHIATSGCLARAAVAEGDFADYSGCWPKEIRQEIANLQSNDTVSLGSGIMTLLPVMGTALINANKLDSSNCVKGAVLTIASKDAGRIAAGFPRRVSAADSRLTMIDWVHAASPFIDEIVARSGVGGLSAADMETAITRYVGGMPAPPSAWITGTRDYGSFSMPLAGAKRRYEAREDAEDSDSGRICSSQGRALPPAMGAGWSQLDLPELQAVEIPDSALDDALSSYPRPLRRLDGCTA